MDPLAIHPTLVRISCNMKISLLLGLLLLGACAVRSTTAPVSPSSTVMVLTGGPGVTVITGGPGATPKVGTRSIMVALPDSLEATYTRLLAGLAKAGYQLPTLSHKASGQAVSFSTKPKTVANVAGLSLQVVIDPKTSGSEVTFMGNYVPVDSLGQAERDSRKWKWIHYGVPANNLPTQAFWDDMQRVALETFPGGRVRYW